MTENTQVTLLRRMTRSQGAEVADNPLTSSRAVRLALTKAANDTVGLSITVQSVAEEVTDLDDMLGALTDDLMLIGLMREASLVGFVALDMEMRAAVLEVATMRAVLPKPAETRRPTRTDKTLCDPFVAGFLTGLSDALLGTPLDGWLDQASPGERIDTVRAAGLELPDCAYRIVAMTVDLGVGDRQATLVVVLPPNEEKVPPKVLAVSQGNWDAAFQAVLSETPAQLDAVLHRFPMTLAAVEGLQIGSVLPLRGCTVNSLCLQSTEGKVVTQAKLGQVAGYRAVRIEQAPAPQLEDLPAAAQDQGLSAPLKADGVAAVAPALEGAIDTEVPVHRPSSPDEPADTLPGSPNWPDDPDPT